MRRCAVRNESRGLGQPANGLALPSLQDHDDIDFEGRTITMVRSKRLRWYCIFTSWSDAGGVISAGVCHLR